MSTRGCIVIETSEVHHFIFSSGDSYPEGLGRALVWGIREADLAEWAALAEKLRSTEGWLGPSFRLTEPEIEHIERWVSNEIQVEASLKPPRAEGVTINVRQGWKELDISGMALADLLRPILNLHPDRFFRTFDRALDLHLRLGLVPRLSTNFVQSPFCEWIYLIDFVGETFAVGKSHWDPDDQCKPLAELWEPVETSEFEWCPIAEWPLRRIPTDWVRLVLEGWRDA